VKRALLVVVVLAEACSSIVDTNSGEPIDVVDCGDHPRSRRCSDLLA
jgi:hypothetical protein